MRDASRAAASARLSVRDPLLVLFAVLSADVARPLPGEVTAAASSILGDASGEAAGVTRSPGARGTRPSAPAVHRLP